MHLYAYCDVLLFINGDGCDAGTLCCKDPQAAGAGTGACYKVSNCSVIRDGRYMTVTCNLKHGEARWLQY